MKTWKFYFRGTLPAGRKTGGGSNLLGYIEIRATDVNEALSKFNLVFVQSLVHITKIEEE